MLMLARPVRKGLKRRERVVGWRVAEDRDDKTRNYNWESRQAQESTYIQQNKKRSDRITCVESPRPKPFMPARPACAVLGGAC